MSGEISENEQQSVTTDDAQDPTLIMFIFRKINSTRIDVQLMGKRHNLCQEEKK